MSRGSGPCWRCGYGVRFGGCGRISSTLTIPRLGFMVPWREGSRRIPVVHTKHGANHAGTPNQGSSTGSPLGSRIHVVAVRRSHGSSLWPKGPARPGSASSTTASTSRGSSGGGARRSPQGDGCRCPPMDSCSAASRVCRLRAEFVLLASFAQLARRTGGGGLAGAVGGGPPKLPWAQATSIAEETASSSPARAGTSIASCRPSGRVRPLVRQRGPSRGAARVDGRRCAFPVV